MMDRRGPLLQAKRRGANDKRSSSSLTSLYKSIPYIGIGLAGVLLISFILYLVISKNQKRQESLQDELEQLKLLYDHPSEHFCKKPRPLICAHGGDLSAAPPNTLRAFQVALEGSSNCIEVDVSMTKDGQLVALHNRDLEQLLGRDRYDLEVAVKTAPNRKLAGGGNNNNYGIGAQIAEYNWDELQRLAWRQPVLENSNTASLQAKGTKQQPANQVEDELHSVELFSTILELAMQHAAHITVDVKLNEQSGHPSKHSEDLATAVLAALEQAGCGNRCLVWAKSDDFIKTIKQLSPDVRTGYIVLNETAEARAAGMHKVLRLPESEVMGVHHAMASAALTEKAKKAGKLVHVWTANTAGMMRSALDSGPDAVVTSHPKKLLEALNKRRNACWRMRRRAAG